MFQTSKRRFALLALFALTLVTTAPTTYVHAEDVTVVEDAAPVESSTATEEVIDSNVVENVEEKFEEPVEEVAEDIVMEEKEEEEEEKLEEAAAPVVIDSSKEEEEVEEVKDASDKNQEGLNQPTVAFVEKGSELIAKVKDAIKSADFDAKKIAAFGLGAWGTATGIGWAMEKIGGKKED
mmetsp:Transcript_8135/g.15315  ORF Transcript_8135/g.15315 Transcript_8135/m.15315 type:complete len:180 (-) Transcript_8135:250-789(-)|eukprot:CAMPEP_0176497488 /NCGR_PEP_ID=MMETSP0200_2-20121128/11748_1 /TAXON_ID=947934 /ORGANISM="Chaetoceros sp., Strain GSL56" /LENGTH=179 /DNA_ID=CAMNT_0017895499 /DNA_START=31 /DNA_END=570 /DNA_ORIENTATION=+